MEGPSPRSFVIASAFARNNKFIFIHFLLTSLLILQTRVSCFTYKVGDLDSWGIPTSSNPDVYTKWSKYHNLTIGDSIWFLYPPSQDSVIQVTAESYKSCNLKNPILYMNDGNSLFNVTSNAVFYFTSGETGHCQKNQKLRVVVGDGKDVLPADGPTASSLPENAAAGAPSYPTVFGNIPTAASSATTLSSSSSSVISLLIFTILGFASYCSFLL